MDEMSNALDQELIRILTAKLVAANARADGLHQLAEKWRNTLDHGCAATFFECADELDEALAEQGEGDG